MEPAEQQKYASATADMDKDGIVDRLGEDLNGDGILNTAETASTMWIVLAP